MKKNQSITPDLTVKELLDRYPQTLPIFMDIGLLCVGCPAEAFHSLADVAREYNLNLNQLVQRIFKGIGENAVSLVFDSPKNNREKEN